MHLATHIQANLKLIRRGFSKLVLVMRLVHNHRIVVLGQQGAEDKTFDELFACGRCHLVVSQANHHSDEQESTDESDEERVGCHL